MMNRAPRRGIGAIAAGVCLLAVPSSAFVREQTSGGQGLVWKGFSQAAPIQWLLDDTPSGGAGNGAIVTQQFQQWTSTACGEFYVSTTPGSVPHASAAAANDGKNEILWADTWPPSGCPTCSSAVLGLTTPWFDPTTGQISEADIQFNAQDWSWQTEATYASCTESKSGCADTASITLHEEGHFLGLGHPPVSAAVMYATWNGTPKRQLASDDISGVCAIYPSATPGSGTQGIGCAAATDCTSPLTCGTPASGGGAICTPSCAGPSATTCPTGTTCQSAVSGFACFAPPATSGSGEGLGQPCNGTTEPCAGTFLCVSLTYGGTGSPDGGTTTPYTCFASCAPGSTTSCNPNQECLALENSMGTPTGMGACVDNPPVGLGQSCSTAPCEAGLVCVGPDPADDVCQPACTTTADCTSPLVCTGGACLPQTVGECEACSDTVSCLEGFACVPLGGASTTSICRTACSADSTCSAVPQSVCLPSTVIGGMGMCSCAIDLGTVTEGQPCLSQAFCSTGDVCVGTPGAQVCRVPCTAGGNTCESGDTCQVFGTLSACAPGPVGAATLDGGTGAAPASGGCGCSSANPLELSASLVAVVGGLRRRRRRT